jgi:hypothetical protein
VAIARRLHGSVRRYACTLAILPPDMPLSPLLAHLSSLDASAQAAPNRQGGAAPVFAAQGRLPGEVLRVEVDGVGALTAPLTPALAEALHRASTPARFGRREQTLLDAAVRHTGEIAADDVTLLWSEGAFAALEREVASALGLEQLQASLHNLLVYGQGQFFKPHQDTEKRPGMVATLVVVWASAHLGGALCVRHGGSEERFESQQLGQAATLRWFAFYADCRHEVLPVEEGWRVALTFDLVLPRDAAPTAMPADPGLVRLLSAAFETGQGPCTATRVLLLDHEYTEHGLRWHLLKAGDRPRALALRAAARVLGLEVSLALAEVHQTWTATFPDSGYRRRGGRAADPVPDELIEDQLTLDFWVDAQGQPQARRALHVDPALAWSLTDTGPEHLVDEEYEGYMGNYGETLDYWYRRAAVVLQSPLGAWRSRFASDFDAALQELVMRARADADGPSPPALTSLVAAVADLLEARSRGRDGPDSRFDDYAVIAARLPAADLAMRVMRGFGAAALVVDHVASIAALQVARGRPWLRGLIAAWVGDMPVHGHLGTGGGRGTAFDAAALVARWLEAGLDDAALDEVLTALLARTERMATALEAASLARRQADAPLLLELTCDLARALALAPRSRVSLARLIEAVLRRPASYPLLSLVPLIEAVGRDVAARTPAAASLLDRVAAAHEAFLSMPARAPGDHALRGLAWSCRCADCSTARQWAESASALPLVLAVAESRRLHVQGVLESAAAPVAAQTIRQGSPYKLQLNKPADLHAREQARRDAVAATAAWLRRPHR